MNRSLVMILSGMFFAATVWAEVPDYSADMVRTTADGKRTSGKIYSSGLKSRVDDGRRGVVVIDRRDLGFSYQLQPDKKTYTKQPIPKGSLMREWVEIGADAAPGMIAPEGVNMKLFKRTQQAKKGSFDVYRWVGEDGVPVKIEPADHRWVMEYVNKALGPQPASLFEVPSDHKEVKVEAPRKKDLPDE